MARRSSATGRARTHAAQARERQLTLLLLQHCRERGLPVPIPQYRFAAKTLGRQWRADLYFPPDLLVEIEGGRWTGGRHVRPQGFAADLEKYNAATLLGYRVLRVLPEQIERSTEAAALIATALGVAPDGAP